MRPLKPTFDLRLSLSPPPGETFSENYSLSERCQPCTLCTGLMRMQTPCTDSNDAVCVCNYNFFFDRTTGGCSPCTVCPPGQGVYAVCVHNHDTVCEECVEETFSERDSSLDPCLPCTICDEETETQLEECTPLSDSVCHSESPKNRNLSNLQDQRDSETEISQDQAEEGAGCVGEGLH